VTLNVVKIGGSLAQKPKALQALCQKLCFLADKHRIVVVPGGGKFADCVRAADKEFSLSALVSHRMAILGMDQYGLLLTDFIPNSQVVDQIKTVKKVSSGVFMFLPSKFMSAKSGLPNSWEVTSDTISAFVAEKLVADNLILVKDVDGVFADDPKKNGQLLLLEQLTVEELLEMKSNSCTDAYLPKLLKVFSKTKCHIINGFYPKRIENILNKQKATGTIISSA
jgi:aspartokinase-like uncharacterized kinase